VRPKVLNDQPAAAAKLAGIKKVFLKYCGINKKPVMPVFLYPNPFRSVLLPHIFYFISSIFK
jgi:hypothetical protein